MSDTKVRYYAVYIKELESDEKHRICVVNVI